MNVMTASSFADSRKCQYPLVRRALAWVVAVALLVQSAACSFVPARPNDHRCARERAEVLASANEYARDQQAIFFNATMDGNRSCATAVPADVYDVRLVATWSDGKTEAFPSIVLKFEPGRQYEILAHEAGVGYVPATAVLLARQAPEDTVAPGSGPDLRGLGGAPVLAMVVILVAIPIFIAMGIASESRKIRQAQAAQVRAARLAMNCCHVWIEDVETRAIIAGVAPSAK